MKKISVIMPWGENYTPRGAMLRWAALNSHKVNFTPLGAVLIPFEGKNYKYHHWEINRDSTGTETVTLYLEELKK